MSADEIYCRSCGERIKRSAEICPHCGVRNQEYQPANSGAAGNGGTARNAGGRGGAPNQQAQGQGRAQGRPRSEPSDSWVYGVGAGLVLWFLIMILQFQSMRTIGTMMRGGAPPGLSGFGSAFAQAPLVLVAWVLLPLSLHYDSKYVSMNSNWDVSGGKYVAVGVLGPILNSIATIVGFALGLYAIAGIVGPAIVVAVTGYYLNNRQDAMGSPA